MYTRRGVSIVRVEILVLCTSLYINPEWIGDIVTSKYRQFFFFLLLFGFTMENPIFSHHYIYTYIHISYSFFCLYTSVQQLYWSLKFWAFDGSNVLTSFQFFNYEFHILAGLRLSNSGCSGFLLMQGLGKNSRDPSSIVITTSSNLVPNI